MRQLLSGPTTMTHLHLLQSLIVRQQRVSQMVLCTLMLVQSDHYGLRDMATINGVHDQKGDAAVLLLSTKVMDCLLKHRGQTC